MNTQNDTNVEATNLGDTPKKTVTGAFRDLGTVLLGALAFAALYPVNRVRAAFGGSTLGARALRLATLWVVIIALIGILGNGAWGEGVRYNSAVAAQAALEGEFAHAGEYTWRTVTLQGRPGIMTRAANALF